MSCSLFGLTQAGWKHPTRGGEPPLTRPRDIYGALVSYCLCRAGGPVGRAGGLVGLSVRLVRLRVARIVDIANAWIYLVFSTPALAGLW